MKKKPGCGSGSAFSSPLGSGPHSICGPGSRKEKIEGKIVVFLQKINFNNLHGILILSNKKKSFLTTEMHGTGYKILSKKKKNLKTEKS